MTIDMTKRPGRRVEGRDYSVALIDLLPEMLKERPMTKREIEKAAGRNHSTVTRALDLLAGSIYVAEWSRGVRGPITPRWGWGNKPNATKPAPIPQSERSRRYRETEHGRKVTKRAQRRWRKSANGKVRERASSVAAYARKKIAEGGIDAILRRDRLAFALLGGGRSQGVAEMS